MDYPKANYQDHWDLADKLLGKKSMQQRRLVTYLLQNQPASTAQVARTCSIGNIGDVSAKANKILFTSGLFIHCTRPVVPIPNQFKEESNMFLWHIVKLPDDMIERHIKLHGLDKAEKEESEAA